MLDAVPPTRRAESTTGAVLGDGAWESAAKFQHLRSLRSSLNQTLLVSVAVGSLRRDTDSIPALPFGQGWPGLLDPIGLRCALRKAAREGTSRRMPFGSHGRTRSSRALLNCCCSPGRRLDEETDLEIACRFLASIDEY